MSPSRRPVDLDRLADFVGGALDGTPEATEVRHLIADDPDWAEAYADVAAADSVITAELGALDTSDDVMPADVVTRMERALDTAPALHPVARAPGRLTGGRSHRSDAGRPSGGRTVVALPAARKSRRRVALAAAAAVLVCGAGSIVAVPLLRGAGSVDSTMFGAGQADSGAEQPASARAPAPVLASGRDYQPETLAAVPWASLSTAFSGAAPSDVSAAAAAGSEGKTRPQQERAEDHGPAGGATPDPGAIPAELTRLAAPAAREACLGVVIAQYGGRVIVTDYARFAGRPALTVALEGTREGGTGRVMAVVVGPACGRDPVTSDELYHAVV